MENSHRVETSSDGSQPRVPSVTVLVCALIAGLLLVAIGMRDERPPEPSAARATISTPVPTPVSTPPATPSPSSSASPAVRPSLPPANPVRVVIPAAGVDAPLTRLGLDDKGALRPPPAHETDLAGWYGDGTVPGEVGTAIVAGHVDTPLGPGVFYGLGSLTRGDTVAVVREDLRTAVFTVDAVEVHDKSSFPDDKVYGSSDRPELRVITCGGGYSESTGYLGNVVVYATLTALR